MTPAPIRLHPGGPRSDDWPHPWRLQHRRRFPQQPGRGTTPPGACSLRGGYFGVPNFIADELFYQHPDIAGSSIGAEIRYHGEDGGRGVSSIGLAVDYATAEADGIWQAGRVGHADASGRRGRACSPSR